MTKSDLICYKNYYGSVHFDSSQKIFYRKIEFIRDLITYEASDAETLIRHFHEAVDEYLDQEMLLEAKTWGYKASEL